MKEIEKSENRTTAPTYGFSPQPEAFYVVIDLAFLKIQFF